MDEHFKKLAELTKAEVEIMRFKGNLKRDIQAARKEKRRKTKIANRESASEKAEKGLI